MNSGRDPWLDYMDYFRGLTDPEKREALASLDEEQRGYLERLCLGHEVAIPLPEDRSPESADSDQTPVRNIFDSWPESLPDDFGEFFRSHSVEDMLNLLRQSSIDPNDIPCIADMAFFFCGADGRPYAKALYGEGIRRLESGDVVVADNVDLLAAKRQFCACCLPGSPLEAAGMVGRTPEVVATDPALAALIAQSLSEVGCNTEAKALLDILAQMEPETLKDKLAESQVTPEAVVGLRASVDRALGLGSESSRSSLRHLCWYYSDDLEPFPMVIVDTSIAELEKKGLDRSLLVSLRSAAVTMVSPDRKVWYVKFFDVEDPIPLLDREEAECFMIWFYLSREGAMNGYSIHGPN